MSSNKQPHFRGQQQQYYDEDGMEDEEEANNLGRPQEEFDEQELNEEESKRKNPYSHKPQHILVVQVIIQLGNDILKSLGVEEPIDDVAVFFSDEFYIQFFQAAFPEIDFSQLTPA